MSPTTFKLALAAIGMAAVLWTAPRQDAQADACKARAGNLDLPRVSAGTFTQRRILL